VNKDTTNFTVAMERVESIKWQHQLSLNESSHQYFEEKKLHSSILSNLQNSIQFSTQYQKNVKIDSLLKLK